MVTTARGVSSVISVILMVAIVVILAATVSVPFFGIVEDINEPAPNVADTTGEFDVADGRAGDEQTVKITHIAGDDISVQELEIVVRASGPALDTTARLVDLPAEGRYMTDNIDGNKDLIDSRTAKTQIIEADDSNIWEAGSTIKFRIAVTGADFRNPPVSGPTADKLEVIIVHTESNAILSENTFRPS